MYRGTLVAVKRTKNTPPDVHKHVDSLSAYSRVRQNLHACLGYAGLACVMGEQETAPMRPQSNVKQRTRALQQVTALHVQSTDASTGPGTHEPRGQSDTHTPQAAQAQDMASKVDHAPSEEDMPSAGPAIGSVQLPSLRELHVSSATPPSGSLPSRTNVFLPAVRLRRALARQALPDKLREERFLEHAHSMSAVELRSVSMRFLAHSRRDGSGVRDHQGAENMSRRRYESSSSSCCVDERKDTRGDPTTIVVDILEEQNNSSKLSATALGPLYPREEGQSSTCQDEMSGFCSQLESQLPSMDKLSMKSCQTSAVKTSEYAASHSNASHYPTDDTVAANRSTSVHKHLHRDSACKQEIVCGSEHPHAADVGLPRGHANVTQNRTAAHVPSEQEIKELRVARNTERDTEARATSADEAAAAHTRPCLSLACACKAVWESVRSCFSCIWPKKDAGAADLVKEIEILSALKHPNITM